MAGKKAPHFRILIAEDSLDLLETLSRAFGERGHQVVPTTNGRDALKRMADQRFDVVITDLHMPAGDGFELLRRVRRMKDPAPIVVMTSSTLIDEPASRRLGAEALLHKPLNVNKLIRAVEWLGRKFSCQI